MLTHETSPVSGASVVGMTSGVCQGQRNLPAGIPGISTALRQEDRLRPKGRLRQQPAGDSAEESRSRAKKKDSSNGCFAESGLAPTRSTEAKDGHDASHVQTPPTSEQEPSPQKNPRQKGGHMPPRCRSKGGKTLYKVPPSEKESGARRSRQRHSHGGAGSRAAGHLTYNQALAYIRGSGPLD
jgi:hypothetical protein